MQNIYIGEFIRQRRKELNLSQEDLSYGICEISTLSRIENGHCTPSRSKINALLQRLGLPEERYYAIVSKNEKEIEALKKEIVACNVMHQPQKGYELLEQLEKICEPDDFLMKQFILRSRILLGDLDGSIAEQKQIELLLQAIKITVPDFSIDRINDFLYTFDEIKIINQLVNTYSDMNEFDIALQIFAQLIKYIEKHFHEIILKGDGMFPMVLHGYARTLDLAKRYQESLDIAEKGKKVCVNYGNYQFLPGFIALSAEDCYFLGEAEKSEECYKEAYYLYKAFEDKEALSILCEDAKKHLNLDFPH